MKLGLKLGLMSAMVAAVAMTAVPFDAEAKRLGGSRSSGAQRQAPDKPMQKAPADATPNATPGSTAAAPTAGAAAAAAPAAAARRNWTGPLMGLAAGLGLAALFSSLGMGEGMANVMMMLLLGMVAFGLFRWFMSRRAKASGEPSLAMAGADRGNAMARSAEPLQAPAMQRTTSDTSNVQIGSALIQPLAVPGVTPAASQDAQRYLPADFDTAAFERIAKTVFIRMQAANDERNLDDLRAFTTPEMFAELRTDLMERGDAPQTTDVVSVNPTVIDFAEEDGNQIVSVRYVGVIREQVADAAESFDEVWHLVKPIDGGPAWRISGIQQRS